jgi:cytidyltransferase-like protein
MATIAISGGFDPIHCGHLDLIESASMYGDVVVILNSDEWLVRKKGYKVMPWEDRARIMRALRDVHNVISVDDSDGTVCKGLLNLKPEYFANGGDRTSKNTPELKLCEEIGIEPVFGVGGKKTASSSELINAIR